MTHLVAGTEPEMFPVQGKEEGEALCRPEPQEARKGHM